MFKKLSIAVTGSALIVLGVAEAVRAATFTSSVFASGLDNPRGLSFGPDGALYVTEAGNGGTGACVPSPSVQGASMCYGPTGAVTRIQNGEQTRVVTGLPSLALPDGREANGPNDIAFDSTGKPYVVTALATNPAYRDSVLGVPDFGQLITLDFNSGSWTNLADLSAYELFNNPDGTDLISNPYALLIQDDTAFVVDSGANDILRVGLDGSGLTLEHAFEEDRVVSHPLTGSDTPLQSVPTSIAKGPDQALYVGELTGVPFPEGAARIYRFTPGNEPEVYTDGFTQIIDLAFAPDGNLYVLEYAAKSLLSGDPTGALIRVAPDGSRTNISSNELIYPTAMTVGSDGAVYVSNKGSIAGEGEILKFVDAKSVPENSSPTLGFIILGGLYGLDKLCKRSVKKKVDLTPESSLNPNKG